MAELTLVPPPPIQEPEEMTDDLIPPDELVKEWQRDSNHNEPMFPQVAQRAAQWGADKELECIKHWLRRHQLAGTAEALHVARRPRPLSPKNEALNELAISLASGEITPMRAAKIRVALEQVPDK